MAKDPSPIKATCGVCRGRGTIQKQYKGVYDPKTGKAETVYRDETCGTCRGRGTLN